MKKNLNTLGFAISIYGEFDPISFQPNWLFHHNIEPSKLLNAVTLISISQYISNFSVADTYYKVEQSRFDINSIDGDPKSIVEKITKVSNLLPHKAIQRISIDRYINCKSHSESERKKLLDKLLPLKNWGRFGEEVKQDNSVYITGLYNLSMFSHESSKDKSVLKRFYIEPIIENGDRTGLFAVVNFGFTINSIANNILFNDYSKLIENEFKNRITEADEMFKMIFKI